MKAVFKCKSNSFFAVSYAAVMNAVYEITIPEQKIYSGSGTPVTIKAHKEAIYSFTPVPGEGEKAFQFVDGTLTLTDKKEIEAFRIWVEHGHSDIIEEIEG